MWNTSRFLLLFFFLRRILFIGLLKRVTEPSFCTL
nr:MAG TPA: hypothetical protein [Caudoviricetes sp.]DAX04653.1 MAG TPA: hypothetical protein [Bacteriophage sp.]